MSVPEPIRSRGGAESRGNAAPSLGETAASRGRSVASRRGEADAYSRGSAAARGDAGVSRGRSVASRRGKADAYSRSSAASHGDAGVSRGKTRRPPDGKADVFQAVADPTRRSMLMLLADGELAIVDLAERFPISRTAVNKHLHVLAEAGLVSRRRVGRETRYRFRPEPLNELKQWLAFFDRYWDEKLASLKEFVEKGDD